MADVLSKSNLFSVCDNRSASISRRRRSLSAVRFARCKSKSFEGLRSSSSSSCSKSNGFLGERLDFGDPCGKGVRANRHATSVQMTLAFPKAMKWWKKGLQPNMKEIDSAQDLVDSLLNAGNKLVIVDFFSPGCGGCKALHPKICQFAEQNPSVLFLQVNYEEHKSMCYSLNVHVLPFFRFYRGANGRLCSFSCTNATIKKFKDALAKHGTERCSLGPAKGLEESELLSPETETSPSPTQESRWVYPTQMTWPKQFRQAQSSLLLNPQELPMSPRARSWSELGDEMTDVDAASAPMYRCLCYGCLYLY